MVFIFSLPRNLKKTLGSAKQYKKVIKAQNVPREKMHVKNKIEFQYYIPALLADNFSCKSITLGSLISRLVGERFCSCLYTEREKENYVII